MTSTPPDNFVGFLEAKLATEVGPHEASNLVKENKAVLVDVRTKESFDKGHIQGATHIPRAELGNRLAQLPKDKTIIAYCSNIGCQSSLKATITLRKAGVDARHLIGGFADWKASGRPVEGTNLKPSATAAPGAN